jgi:hypothetical protein
MKTGGLPITKAVIESQPFLDLKPVKELEVDGIGMGVLSDGTPYLTARGLARMCGVSPSVIIEMGNNWGAEQLKPRGTKIASILAEQGFTGNSLYLKLAVGGTEVSAYTDAACMAVLEYYAFETDFDGKHIALRNYRLLARFSFRSFIYARLGYDPKNQIPDPWKKFQDRILLNYNEMPAGYFSIFRELANFIIYLIQQDMLVDEHTVPDSSVGRIWSEFWQENGFEEKYGKRTKWEHNYPDYFPQAQANPHDVWVYPENSLGEFRQWMRDVYLCAKFPAYLKTKVKQGFFPPSKVEILLGAVAPKALQDQNS